jgi:hypothetical protein
MPSPANITGIFLDTTANRPTSRDSPPLAFDRCNRYTLSLAIEKKMNVWQSGPGQARMHPWVDKNAQIADIHRPSTVALPQ